MPVLPGSGTPIKDNNEAKILAGKMGFPVIVKASMGGGGRGMRVALSPDKLDEALDRARPRRRGGHASASYDIFLERFVQRARHIEVQLLGDRHGGLVHLFERDCSLQRRHQKIVEIAPAHNLEPGLRQRILDAALAVGRAVRLDNAGTVEFLVDADTGEFFFIEVNPRIQVEHTVTEEVTGYDIVKSQILIAQGLPLVDPDIGLGDQSAVTTHGFAVQCRVTTEDPAINFVPDYGRMTAYRSASGLGIRLDAGSAFGGAVITPFYDSLLVKRDGALKPTASSTRPRRMERSLQEFRVRGVKTNIPFLINLVMHPQFQAGGFTTRFLDETPDLFHFPARQDRASKLLGYIADIIVNGHPEMRRDKAASRPVVREVARAPSVEKRKAVRGSRDGFHELGRERFVQWIKDQKALLLTDTTFRDAHQSLLATPHAHLRHAADRPGLLPRSTRACFSLEMWGGATFEHLQAAA